MDVYIIGFGGNARVVADICALNANNVVGYFDDWIEDPLVLGKIDCLLSKKWQSIRLINAIGDVKVRQTIYHRLKEIEVDWINCIHPTAIISPSVKMSIGNIIGANVVINAGVTIGSFNLINTGSVLEHDCVVGDFNHLAPRSTFCGSVKIGQLNLIGANSTVIPGLTIGNENVVGSMCAVTTNIGYYQKMVGIPNRSINDITYKSSWPAYNEKMINDVKDILVSGKVNQWTGSKVFQFEKAFARYVGVKHAIAVSNGTVALQMCLMALSLPPNSEVIVPARTFIASAAVINLSGHLPVFVDVDSVSQNITLENIMKATTLQTKAVILVHLAGWPCEVQEIVNWCHQHHIYVIEDCAQAHGAKYNNQSVGSFGDINAWSFCQDKIISTGGEGGMITTNNDQWQSFVWSFKDHGKNYHKMMNNDTSPGLFRWVHDKIGTNYRLTEIAASIGLNSLDCLDGWVTHRRAAAHILNTCLQNVPLIRLTLPPPHCYHAYYKYYCFIQTHYLAPNVTRNHLIDQLNRMHIPCFEGTCGEIYREVAYNLHYHLPVTRNLSDTSLMFAIDPTLSLTVIKAMAEKLKWVFLNASCTRS